MKSTDREKAPDVLGGQAGASEKVGSGFGNSPDPIIHSTVLDDNARQDPIVQAIRILARRGRQLREAEEAAPREEMDDGEDAQTDDHQSTKITQGSDR